METSRQTDKYCQTEVDTEIDTGRQIETGIGRQELTCRQGFGQADRQ